MNNKKHIVHSGIKSFKFGKIQKQCPKKNLTEMKITYLCNYRLQNWILKKISENFC